MTARLHRYGVAGLAAASVAFFVLSSVFLGASSAWADFGINGALWPSSFAAMALVGALIGWRRVGHPIAWTLTLTALLMTLNGFAQHYAMWVYDVPDTARPGGALAAWLALWTWIPASGLVTLTLLLFPTGGSISRRWSWLSRLVVAATVATLPAAMLTWPERGAAMLAANGPDEVAGGAVLNIVANGLIAPLLLAGPTALIVRFRRARGDERQQLKWLVFAGSLIVAAMITMLVVSFIEQTDDPIEHPVAALAFLISMTSIPIASAIAILKYRLYEIDVVISRTVVFAGLAGFITAIYVGIVVGVGSLLGTGDEPNLALSIVATGVVAVAFQPVRERLTRLANRLVFGKRATPYEVLSTFAEHLGGTAASGSTLERMAKLVADGTGAERVVIWLRVGEVAQAAAVWPEVLLLDPIPDREADARDVFGDFDHVEEVRHDRELLGAITVAEPRGESLNHTEEELLRDLAGQAALVMRNLRLTGELRARIDELHRSRERIVRAQEDERRRLERDLHDGIQQQLAQLAHAVRAAGAHAEGEGATEVAGLLTQVANDGETAGHTILELAHGIYPPLLVAEGLVGALRAHALEAAVPIVVEPDGIGRYSQEIEAAVYFCVLEAVQNAAKYASPSQVTVRLGEHDGKLTFTVTDDGSGFDPTSTPRGHGTTNMTDRLEALNGQLEIRSVPRAGTTIAGRVPIPAVQETTRR